MSNSLDCCQPRNQGKIGGLLEFLCQFGLQVLKAPFCSIMCDEDASVSPRATGGEHAVGTPVFYFISAPFSLSEHLAFFFFDIALIRYFSHHLCHFNLLFFVSCIL